MADTTTEALDERQRHQVAEVDRVLHELAAAHDLPAPLVVSHGGDPEHRSLVLVVDTGDAWDAWAEHVDTTGVVSPGPYPCGPELLRVRVGQLAGATAVLIVDEALQVLLARPGDVTADQPRDETTTSAADPRPLQPLTVTDVERGGAPTGRGL